MADHDPDSAPANVDKSADKSADSRPALRGAAADPALRGRGPEPGAPNAGRPPNKFRDECLRLQRGPALEKIAAYLEKPENGPDSKHWKWCLEYVAKYGEKQTAKQREHIHDATPAVLEALLKGNAEARRNQPAPAEPDDAT